MSQGNFDALGEFARIEAARKAAEANEAEWQRVTRKLFTLDSGRRWLRLAMARYNFNGSVFMAEDGMNPGNAAHRDGMRNVLSDILNSAFTQTNTDPEDEDSHVSDPPPVR
jgi:hypothetical protein